MYGLTQKLPDVLGPRLFHAKVIEVFKVARQVGRAYLIVKEIHLEVCAMAVRDGNHLLQGVPGPFLEHFYGPYCSIHLSCCSLMT